MTSIAEIISEAMIYIDDVRLQEQLRSNPALFYRRMSAYVSAAMPLLNSPPELYDFVSKNITMPEYDCTGWVSDTQSLSGETQVDTGMIGYDLCSVVIRSEDGLSTTPYLDYTYDSETGIVTFQIQQETGIEYELDFYKDGELDDLTYSMKRLFALAISIVWNERLYNSWLDITPKIKDSAFKSQTESTYIDKLNDRLVVNRQAFQDELRKYEQNCAYRNIVFPLSRKGLL